MPLNETISNYIDSYIGISAGTYESAIITAAAILFSSFILAHIIDFLFEKIFKRLTAKTKFEFDDLIIAAFKRPIFLTVIFIGIYTALGIIYNTGLNIINNIIITVILVIWILATVKATKIVFTHIIPKLTAKTDTDMDDEMIPLAKTISTIIIFFVGFMFILKGVWNVDITPLIASAGILGFAVAFAAQDAISHIFGGVSIYLDKPFKKGDRIEVAKDELGIVQEVGLRSTKIRDFYNNTIIIPNSQIANSKIVNYTSPATKMMVKIIIGVAYGSDVAKVKKVLMHIAKSTDEVIDKPAPGIRFDNHGESSLDFAMIMWVKDPADKFTVIDKVNTAIEKEFKKNKIDIPFPTRTIIQQK
ncbi:MAG: mechanosensitive ion channel family protein [Candidatus Aenigmarchaeota archaeon]|nr:mechanosensitive ion channel family protein [Candidatus Aenigmarchaeota archaeon]